MTKVLVTGAGGPAGIAVIRALGERAQPVVALDTNPLAETRAVVCPTSEPDRFVDELAAVVELQEVDVIVCTVSAEMLALAGREAELRASVWLPKRRSAAACVDRWRFWKIAERARIPAAPSTLGDVAADSIADTLAGPWIVRPRFGHESRVAFRVDDPAELARACRRVEQPVVQTHLNGREFTVDLLADRDGRLAAAVPRWRLETATGVSTAEQTFCDHRITEMAARVVRTYSLTGVAHLQGIVTDDDQVVVAAVNPGFSGGLPLSLAAGADLVSEFVRGTLGMTLRPERLQFRPGVTMVRDDSELFAA